MKTVVFQLNSLERPDSFGMWVVDNKDQPESFNILDKYVWPRQAKFKGEPDADGVHRLDPSTGVMGDELFGIAVREHLRAGFHVVFTTGDKIAYTLGFTKGYDRALKYGTREQPVVKAGSGHLGDPGGTVWRTREEARTYLASGDEARFEAENRPAKREEFSVYCVALPNGWDQDIVMLDGRATLRNPALLLGRVS